MSAVINGQRVHPGVTVEVVVAAVQRQRTSLDNPGFCIVCAEEAEGVEPDAEGYVCEVCDQPAVYGAEQLLIYLA